ncbi:MAG: YdeI/OmpD-associated family protein [Bacteroidota bacterium]|nr:YdeI/OmpD-associated family protein [Bacteroidota bacterium]
MGSKITITALIKKFHDKGEKTGWTYIEVPFDLAEQLFPNNKKSFRVKGKLDAYDFDGIALLPMGDGNFIMALNSTIRKEIRKGVGALVKVQMEMDLEEKPLSEEFLTCLSDDPGAQNFFNTLPKGHQRYFSNWIETAKTNVTKVKRIAQAVNALATHMGFGEMIRLNKQMNH